MAKKNTFIIQNFRFFYPKFGFFPVSTQISFPKTHS